MLAPQPQTTIDRRDYEDIVGKHAPSLMAAAPEQALQLFCDLLANAIACSPRAHYRDSSEDGSYLWCPSVSDCGPGEYRVILSVLGASVRDAANAYASCDGGRVREIIELYDSKRWRVFERLGYHLLCCFPECAPDLVSQRLTDSNRFDVFSTRYEYERLAERCFAGLTSEDQQQILAWIDKGPALAEADRPEDYADRWRRDRLAPISRALPAGWDRRNAELVKRFGEAPREPFRASSGGRVGADSPIAVDELRVKTVQGLVEYLDSWREPSRFRGASYEGLVETVKEVVSEDPARFIECWEAFKRVSRRYFYALLLGFREAMNKNWQADWWTATLSACQWAMEQPGAPTEEDRDGGGRAESTWTWVPGLIVDLLSAGFEDSDHTIPYEQREQAWRLLQLLASHPDPPPTGGVREGESPGMDYLTASFNCVRGRAMHAVVRYALWLRRRWDECDDCSDLISSGFDAMPDVRDVLDEHLDSAVDGSPAIRAVYGQWFPWLCLLDRRWASKRADDIFAEQGQAHSMWEAAWTSYIGYCPAYNDVLPILRRFYAKAIANLSCSDSDGSRDGGVADRLAEHLMLYYGRGLLAIDDDLLERFFSSAPPSVRGQAVQFVGWSLAREQGELPADVLKRFQELWEKRVAALCASGAEQPRDPELVAFGSWFSSGRFDAAWALVRLRDALRVCGWSEPHHEVVGQIAAVAGADLAASLECVAHLVDGDTQGWGDSSLARKSPSHLQGCP